MDTTWPNLTNGHNTHGTFLCSHPTLVVDLYASPETLACIVAWLGAHDGPICTKRLRDSQSAAHEKGCPKDAKTSYHGSSGGAHGAPESDMPGLVFHAPEAN